MDFAHAMDDTRIIQDTLCGRGFAGINMGNNANIADTF
jgi:hypothetical protein